MSDAIVDGSVQVQPLPAVGPQTAQPTAPVEPKPDEEAPAKPRRRKAASAERPTPTTGRVVHYTTAAQQERTRAALVFEVEDEQEGTVSLHVFNGVPPFIHLKTGVEFSEEPAAGCWSWPPRS